MGVGKQKVDKLMMHGPRKETTTTAFSKDTTSTGGGLLIVEDPYAGDRHRYMSSNMRFVYHISIIDYL